MKIDVFGKRTIEVVREEEIWVIYALGEGRRIRSNDIVIPSHLTPEEVLTFIGDIFHEGATPENSEVKLIE